MSVGTPSTDLAAEDVSTLSSSSWLSVSSDRVRATHISLFYFSDHLHLVSIIHDKFLAIYCISSVDWSHSLASSGSTLVSRPLEHDLALAWHCRYLVVIFLNWRQIYINSVYMNLIQIIFMIALIFMRYHLAYRLGLFLIWR